MIEELAASDAPQAVAIWESVRLTRPWNDSFADFTRAIEGATSTVLGLRLGEELVGTVMVGSDGHRGWVYYLAVVPAHQGSGLGARLMASAEAWLRERGAVKVQLMVRDTNAEVMKFYAHLGYDDGEVSVLAKWISPPS
jgi:ribosomal protein S18 acetylase RimI-like enzyme